MVRARCVIVAGIHWSDVHNVKRLFHSENLSAKASFSPPPPFGLSGQKTTGSGSCRATTLQNTMDSGPFDVPAMLTDLFSLQQSLSVLHYRCALPCPTCQQSDVCLSAVRRVGPAGQRCLLGCITSGSFSVGNGWLVGWVNG